MIFLHVLCLECLLVASLRDYLFQTLLPVFIFSPSRPFILYKSIRDPRAVIQSFIFMRSSLSADSTSSPVTLCMAVSSTTLSIPRPARSEDYSKSWHLLVSSPTCTSNFFPIPLHTSFVWHNGW
jgi:hypothetical protein